MYWSCTDKVQGKYWRCTGNVQEKYGKVQGKYWRSTDKVQEMCRKCAGRVRKRVRTGINLEGGLGVCFLRSRVNEISLGE